MNLTWNIILWTFSLLLATIGIIFGFIASVNSHKANIAVKELVEASWISDESAKLFFRNIKRIIVINRAVLVRLEKKITYKQYDAKASETRLPPINVRAYRILAKTEYKKLLEAYAETKRFLETEFISIIESFAKLSTTDLIPTDKRKALIKYHKDIEGETKKIISSFAKLTHANSK